MSIIGVEPDRLAVDELESIVAMLGSPNFAWVMHQLASGPLEDARHHLQTCKPENTGQIGRLQGAALAYSGMPNLAKTLKQEIEVTIDRKRKEEESNGG